MGRTDQSMDDRPRSAAAGAPAPCTGSVRRGRCPVLLSGWACGREGRRRPGPAAFDQGARRRYPVLGRQGLCTPPDGARRRASRGIAGGERSARTRHGRSGPAPRQDHGPLHRPGQRAVSPARPRRKSRAAGTRVRRPCRRRFAGDGRRPHSAQGTAVRNPRPCPPYRRAPGPGRNRTRPCGPRDAGSREWTG